MRRGFALLLVFAAGAFAACTDLKRAEDDPGQTDLDGGGTGDGTTGGGDGDTLPGNDAAIDVGQPPLDFECSEPWKKEPKLSTQCAPRQVKEIEEGAPDMNDISIARTPAGRVGVAFFAPQSFDEGEMRLVHFAPDTPSYTPKLITRPGNFALQSGYHVKLAASAPDTLHILSHDVDEQTSGDLLYMRLVEGKEPLTSPEVVLTALEQKTEVALASDSAGNVFATARVTTGTKDGGAPIAKLIARKKTGNGIFTAMPDLAVGMSPSDAPGVGGASLLFDSAGKENALFHYADSMFGSQPLYHVFNGTQWSPKKTVDNATFDGLSGFNPRLAVFGTQKIAAFFFRKQGQSEPTATADLRIVRWSAVADTPDIYILEQGIPSPTMFPRHRVAMAVDVYGLVHVAVIDVVSPTSGRLDYYRETPAPGGKTKWLRDIIDDDVLGADQDAAVDLVVDEKARPHIAYRSGKDLKVRYVTRYDR